MWLKFKGPWTQHTVQTPAKDKLQVRSHTDLHLRLLTPWREGVCELSTVTTRTSLSASSAHTQRTLPTNSLVALENTACLQPRPLLIVCTNTLRCKTWKQVEEPLRRAGSPGESVAPRRADTNFLTCQNSLARVREFGFPRWSCSSQTLGSVKRAHKSRLCRHDCELPA